MRPLSVLITVAYIALKTFYNMVGATYVQNKWLGETPPRASAAHAPVQLIRRVRGPGCPDCRKLCSRPSVCQMKYFPHSAVNALWMETAVFGCLSAPAVRPGVLRSSCVLISYARFGISVPNRMKRLSDFGPMSWLIITFVIHLHTA